MKHLLTSLGFLLILFVLPIGLAAQPLNIPDNNASEMPGFSIGALLRAAQGYDTVWRPDWPQEMPPDIFYAGPGAVSIRAEFGDGIILEFSRDSNGRIRSFPILLENQGSDDADFDRNGMVFFQGRSEYNGQGRLTRISWEENLADMLQWDGENRPVVCRVFSGGYYFIALEYIHDTIIETWYSQEGAPLFVVISEKFKQITLNQEKSFFYNSDGYISKIEYWNPGGEILQKSASALYNSQGLPRYLEREDISYAWQWDTKGHLVRFSAIPSSEAVPSSGAVPSSEAVPAPDPAYILDYRYEYALDSRENWTQRQEIVMASINPPNAGNRLAAEEIRTIRRLISYGGAE